MKKKITRRILSTLASFLFSQDSIWYNSGSNRRNVLQRIKQGKDSSWNFLITREDFILCFPIKISWILSPFGSYLFSQDFSWCNKRSNNNKSISEKKIAQGFNLNESIIFFFVFSHNNILNFKSFRSIFVLTGL